MSKDSLFDFPTTLGTEALLEMAGGLGALSEAVKFDPEVLESAATGFIFVYFSVSHRDTIKARHNKAKLWMDSNHTCKILKLSCLVKISLHLLSRIWSVGRFMILQRGRFLWQILTQFSSNPFPSCDILPSVWKWVLASPAEGASSIHCPKSHAVLWGSRSTGLPNDFGSSSLDNNSSDPFFFHEGISTAKLLFFSAVNSIAEWWWTMKWFGCGCKLGYHRFETILGPIIADHTWLLKSIWRHQKWKLSSRATPARLGMIYELRIFISQSVWIGLSKSPFVIASKPFRSLGRHWRGWFLSFQTLRLVPKYTRVRYTDVGSLNGLWYFYTCTCKCTVQYLL